MIQSAKALLLAGAILACAAEAKAKTFTIPGTYTFVAAVSGYYEIEALGASGGNGVKQGGLGAEVSGEEYVSSGTTLELIVGQAGFNRSNGGGGGGSFVLIDSLPVVVAGGGGGGGYSSGGGPGQAGSNGQAGFATGGSGGQDGNGGQGGQYANGSNGGGGTGVKTGGSKGYSAESGQGGNLPAGGSGAAPLGGNGGYGGGGGGGFGGGGGGGGYSGGGGGGFQAGGGGGGGGGGSYLASPFTDRVLTASVNSGNGSISVDLLTSVPEPSTWAMMATGLAGLGFLAHVRKRKLTAA